MKFKAIIKETVLSDPQKDGTERRIPSEIRIDPLTGRTARICHFMKLQWEKPDFEALVAGTEAWCPFCAGQGAGGDPLLSPRSHPGRPSAKKRHGDLPEHRPLRQPRGRGHLRRPPLYSP